VSLNWRKQLFVAEYLAHPGLNATDVARRCGYTGPHVKTRAYELMRDPEVKAAIEHGQNLRLEEVELTAQDVVKDILAARQRCVEAGNCAWAMVGRLKCDELLGRYLKMWEEKVEVNFADGLAERLRKAREQVVKPGEPQAVTSEPKALPPTPEPESVPKGEPTARTEVAPPVEQEDWVEKYL
jgi:hypothetical protein